MMPLKPPFVTVPLVCWCILGLCPGTGFEPCEVVTVVFDHIEEPAITVVPADVVSAKAKFAQNKRRPDFRRNNDKAGSQIIGP